MNYAVIDIGSNTIRFNIYKWENYKLELLFGKKNVAGLVSYIENGTLSARGINKLRYVLENQLEIINQVATDKIFAFASASLRNISNTEYVVNYIKDNLDLEIEIISQEEEARLGFIGLKLNDNHISGMSADIGGGSSELTMFHADSIEEIINLGDGCLSLFNKYVSELLPKKSEIKAIKDYANQALKSKYQAPPKINILVGIGGTIRACGNIIKEHYQTADHRHFSMDDLDRLYKDLKEKDKDIIDTVLKVTPERIHTIVPGVTLFRTICRYFDVKNITVGSSGLREGFLMEKLK